MYYPSSENKGADQLGGYREAGLRLCFRIGKDPVFSWCGSHISISPEQKHVDGKVPRKRKFSMHSKSFQSVQQYAKMTLVGLTYVLGIGNKDSFKIASGPFSSQSG